MAGGVACPCLGSGGRDRVAPSSLFPPDSLLQFCPRRGSHRTGTGKSPLGVGGCWLTVRLSSQGLQVRPGLHQAQSGDLHRPAGEGEGGARLAAGREDLLHPPAERAGGSVHPGARAGRVCTPPPPVLAPPSPDRRGHLLPPTPTARRLPQQSRTPGPEACAALRAHHCVGTQQVLNKCADDVFA